MELLTAGVLSPDLTAAFLATRISTQLLLRHHLDLWPAKGKPGQRTTTTTTGTTATTISPPTTSSAVQGSVGLAQVAQSAAAEARLLVEAALHISPEVFVKVVPHEHAPGAHVDVSPHSNAAAGVDAEETAAAAASALWRAAAAAATSSAARSNYSIATEDVFVCTSPSYVRYVLLELLKNALRAAAEHPAADKPPVHVLVGVHAQKAWVVVRNSRGGGGGGEGGGECDHRSADLLDASLSQSLARFGGRAGAPALRPAEAPANNSASSPPPGAPALWDRLTEQGSYMPTRAPLHGIGVGLGLSRAHAAYLGGALTVRAFDAVGIGGEVGVVGDQRRPGVEAVLELPLGNRTVEDIPERPVITS